MKEQRTELLVGVFLLFGLVVLGAIIVRFGSLSDYFQESYSIVLNYPDSGGIVESSELRLGGAKIGRVASKPYLNSDTSGVIIEAEIFGKYREKIPIGSQFVIATSGLLGDSYISVRPPSERTGEFIEAGAVVDGSLGAGLEQLANSAEPLLNKSQVMLDDARGALADLNAAINKLNESILRDDNLEAINMTVTGIADMFKKLNEDVLTGENTENLRSALDNFRTTSENLVTMSTKLNDASDKIGPGIESVLALVDRADATLDNAVDGDGLLTAILQDPQMKDDLVSFITNLRRYGVLRYRDRPTELIEAAGAGDSTSENTRRKKLIGRKR